MQPLRIVMFPICECLFKLQCFLWWWWVMTKMMREGVQTSAWSPSDVNSWVTVISFLVRVPVLSEQITLQQPDGENNGRDVNRKKHARTHGLNQCCDHFYQEQMKTLRHRRDIMRCFVSETYPEFLRWEASWWWLFSAPCASRRAPAWPSPRWVTPQGWPLQPGWRREERRSIINTTVHTSLHYFITLIW